MALMLRLSNTRLFAPCVEEEEEEEESIDLGAHVQSNMSLTAFIAVSPLCPSD